MCVLALLKKLCKSCPHNLEPSCFCFIIQRVFQYTTVLHIKHHLHFFAYHHTICLMRINVLAHRCDQQLRRLDGRHSGAELLPYELRGRRSVPMEPPQLPRPGLYGSRLRSGAAGENPPHLHYVNSSSACQMAAQHHKGDRFTLFNKAPSAHA